MQTETYNCHAVGRDVQLPIGSNRIARDLLAAAREDDFERINMSPFSTVEEICYTLSLYAVGVTDPKRAEDLVTIMVAETLVLNELLPVSAEGHARAMMICDSNREPDIETKIRREMGKQGISPTDYKVQSLVNFHEEVNDGKERFPLEFLVKRSQFISPKSPQRVAYLDKRHGEEKATRIVKVKPSILGYRVAKTKSIYDLLDERHGEEKATKIVESYPSVLSYSITRTKSRYDFLDQRHGREKATKILEKKPRVFGASPKGIKSTYGFLDERHGVEDATRIVERNPNVLMYSLTRTKSIYDFLDERHGRDGAEKLVETFPAILNPSLSRTRSHYRFLDERHGEDKANKIIETFYGPLSTSLTRTQSIYDFLDQRHGTEKANEIVEEFPLVLGYALARTKAVYEALSKKDMDENKYVEAFPKLLYFSPKFIRANSLEKIFEAVDSITNRHSKRVVSETTAVRDDFEISRFDRVAYEKWQHAGDDY